MANPIADDFDYIRRRLREIKGEPEPAKGKEIVANVTDVSGLRSMPIRFTPAASGIRAKGADGHDEDDEGIYGYYAD